jgi:hypothetical protein
MEPYVKELLNYGVLGLSVIGLVAYIRYLHKRQDREMEERRNDLKEINSQWRELTREGHQAIRENTSVVASLKQLFETTRDKK